MQCGNAKRLLSLRADDVLGEHEAARLDEHLLSCSSCRRYADRLHLLPGILDVANELPVPPSFTAATMQRIKQSATPVRASARGRPWPAVATTALAAGVAALSVAGLGSLTAEWLQSESNPLLGIAKLLVSLAGFADSLMELAALAAVLLPLILPAEVTGLFSSAAAVAAVMLLIWTAAILPNNAPRSQRTNGPTPV